MNVVVAVHGVGPTSPGEIQSSIEEILRKEGRDETVHEFHWADLEESTDGDSPLSSENLWEILYNPISSSFIEARCGRKQLWDDRKYSFILSEVGRAIVLLPLLAIPLFIPFVFFAFALAELDHNAIEFCALATWDLTRVGLLLLTALCVWDSAVALWRRNPNIAFASIRRNLLHFLGPLFCLLALPFSASWVRRKWEILFWAAGIPFFFVFTIFLFGAIDWFFHVPGKTSYEIIDFTGYLPGAFIVSIYPAIPAPAITIFIGNSVGLEETSDVCDRSHDVGCRLSVLAAPGC